MVLISTAGNLLDDELMLNADDLGFLDSDADLLLPEETLSLE